MKQDLQGEFIPGKTRIKYGGAVVDKAEFEAINSVLARNWWTLAEEGALFEAELAKATDVKYSVYVNSGSSALLLAFSVLDLPMGSEVIIPAVNFPTVVNAALVSGFVPVFVDVNPETMLLDLDKAEKAINKKTKVIVGVNIAGNCVDMKKICQLAKKYGLITILDNCDGYGTTWKGKPIESFVDLSVTSFHAAHIITTGEGGALFTNNKKYYDKARSIREWGRAEDSDASKIAKKAGLPKDYPGRYTYITRGFNLKPIELQAAMGRVQLKKLAKIKNDRLKNFNRLYRGIIEANIFQIIPVKWFPEAEISWFAFPMTVKTNGEVKLRGKLRQFLEDRNIETRVIFAGNVTKHPAYQGLGRVHGVLSNSDLVLENSFFVSVHPTVTFEMIDYIILSLKEFFDEL